MRRPSGEELGDPIGERSDGVLRYDLVEAPLAQLSHHFPVGPPAPGPLERIFENIFIHTCYDESVLVVRDESFGIPDPGYNGRTRKFMASRKASESPSIREGRRKM